MPVQYHPKVTVNALWHDPAGPIPQPLFLYPFKTVEAVPYPLKSHKGHTGQAFQSRSSGMSPAEKGGIFFLHLGC